MQKLSTNIILSLLVTSLLIGCSPSTPAADSRSQPRTITVTGNGTAWLSPDIAYINIDVQTMSASPTEAATQITRLASAVIRALHAQGISAADIQTTNFSLWPNYEYDAENQLTGIVYLANNNFYVAVRNLNKLASILNGAVQAGANNINNILFDVQNKSEALSQARIAAVEEARQQAEEITRNTGIELGEIQYISYYESNPTPYYYFVEGKGGKSVGKDIGVPISTGRMQLITTVTIVFAVE